MTDNTANPNRPAPIDKEVFWDKTQTIISKSDLFGTIDYANEAFVDVSGYEEYELMGKPHSILRHPDMPQVLYKILWDNLKEGNPFQIILKNLAKSGRYYWVTSEFDYSKDSNGNVETYIARRNAIANEILDNHISPLYKKLLQIEQASGIKYSEKYLVGFLEEKGLSFTDFTNSILNNGASKPKTIEIAAEHLENQTINVVEEVANIETESLNNLIDKELVIEEEKSSFLQEIEPTSQTDYKVKDEPLAENQDVKSDNVISKINLETKDEIKSEEVEQTDLSSTSYEQQRETRSGFIGKLFGRE